MADPCWRYDFRYTLILNVDNREDMRLYQIFIHVIAAGNSGAIRQYDTLETATAQRHIFFVELEMLVSVMIYS